MRATHAITALALVAVGCGGESTAPSVDVEPEPLGSAPETGEIAEIVPGGDTVCARGTPYRFYVRGGDPEKVIIDFQGGGACWDEATCAAGESIYFQEPPSYDEFEGMIDGVLWGGYYELDNPDNPFAGWTLIHIPYCTGDIHWGDAVVDYTSDLTIHHRGFVNARTTLDWVAERYQPKQILVSGFSAGSYGAIGHSPHIAEQHPEAEIAVLGDSGAGVITDEFFGQSFPKWNVDRVVPRHVTGLEQVDPQDMTIDDLWVSIANHYADRGLRYAEYSTAYDKDQTTYYVYMGGDPEAWAPKLRTSYEAISGKTENFRYYIAEGPVHGGTVFDVFYLRDTQGTPFTSWLAQVVSGDELPDNVACEGEECLADPVCSACEDGSLVDNGTCYWCLGWTSGN